MAVDPLMSMLGSLGASRPSDGVWAASEVGLAGGHDHGRTGEQHPVVGGPGDAQRAARYVDPVGHVRLVGSVAVGDRRGDHGRTRAGAARPGLTRAALVDAHRDVAGPAAYDE